MDTHLHAPVLPYPDGMSYLDQALQALSTLRGEDHPGTLTARQALRRARLAVAIQKEQVAPRNAETLLRTALAQRGTEPDAAHPAWRTLICALAAHAIARGVPATSVIQAIQADQLVSDLRGEPRLSGEALVISERGQLRLHPDIPQLLPEARSLN